MGKTYRNIRKRDRKKLRENRNKKRVRSQQSEHSPSREEGRVPLHGVDR